MIIVYLKKRGAEKVQRGHLWIYEDEIKSVDSDEEVGIANIFFEDEFMGRGLYNLRANPRLKLLTRKYEEINEEFFVRRFQSALKRRSSLLTSFRREFNAEGDLIPSLIIDRFADTLVVQIRSKALEKMKEDMINAMVKVYAPMTIYERSDFESMPEPGLSREKGVLYGLYPTEKTLEEDKLKFKVNIVKGQKTGFFYDQRESRTFAKKVAVKGGKALDLFTYTGGFAISLASEGMKVDAVDISKEDLQLASENAKLNKVKVNFICQDAFNLNGLEMYDLIIADPPSLIKNRSQKPKAFELLKTLMDQIIDHLNENGKFSICSCAYNIDEEMLKKIVLRSATEKKKVVRLINWTGLPLDHPHLLSMPETNYLKCLWGEIFNF
ncbi:class I SAM-dependent rRNA methyltransferase [Mesoaciditoga lauensis]|uniref:class I SAM-dependent rRNA methyltransferase n=1 Tax=Mesoaciditoga lauensis TaxID=1495039 RepID=UPI00055F02DF|nr:class I SAM-dependent rRNA methyltransferase [Mesoaciditoga lauensis]